MEDEWQFMEARPGGWDWRCVNSDGLVTKVSERTFPQLYDCVEDAKKHGYVPKPISPKGPT